MIKQECNIEVEDTVKGKKWTCKTWLDVKKKTRLSLVAIKARLEGVRPTQSNKVPTRYLIRDLGDDKAE